MDRYRLPAILSRAMAHPTRLYILDALARQEACVCHLTTLLGQRQAHISQHLRVLRDAGLVTVRRDGQMVYYRLNDGRAAAVVPAVARALVPAVPAEPAAPPGLDEQAPRSARAASPTAYLAIGDDIDILPAAGPLGAQSPMRGPVPPRARRGRRERALA